MLGEAKGEATKLISAIESNSKLSAPYPEYGGRPMGSQNFNLLES